MYYWNAFKTTWILHVVLVDHLKKAKKEYKKFKETGYSRYIY